MQHKSEYTQEKQENELRKRGSDKDQSTVEK